MPLVSTAGATNANSYTSLTFAETYLLTERVGSAGWILFDEPDREAALIQATRILERERFKGAKTATTQALKFPRSGIVDEDGDEYDDATVPTDIQRACAEIAFDLLNSPAGGELDGFKSIQIGDDKFDLREGRAQVVSETAQLLIREFVLTTQAKIMRG